MELGKNEVKAGDERTRDNVSSVSDNSMCEQSSVTQKKKKQKNVQNVQRNQSETRSNVDDDTDIVIAATI
ncbi:hypothetical protein DPMN_042054 [Dreissena polymorpha]|uniref:Uncharacterized protein n=1 Tax=Dreissena polymorpha TaxID=45954 RepID=A0A9D4HUF3_DREPO|nr:hypothetical protein DPMN_042054 [Dreissena polymorpha]